MAEKKSVEVADERAGVDAVGLVLVVFAAVVVAGGIIGVAEIISADGARIDSLAQRSEVVRNIGLFLLGVIGLPLAIWRSWIAKQQVDETIAQGIRTERQLQHAEKQLRLSQAAENLGFVEKGGSLLEDETPSSRATGVYMLEAIVNQVDDQVAKSAAGNILYQFIKHHKDRDANDYYLASVALLSGLGRHAASTANNASELEKIGDTSVHLGNGRIRNIYFVRSTNLADCIIENGIIASSGVELIDCDITDALVIKLAEKSERNKFTRCDFSGAHFDCDIEGSEFEGCYYHADHPPTDTTMERIGDQLERRDGSSTKYFFK